MIDTTSANFLIGKTTPDMPGYVAPPTQAVRNIQLQGGQPVNLAVQNTQNAAQTAQAVPDQFSQIINLLKQYQTGAQGTINQTQQQQIQRGVQTPQSLIGASPDQQNAVRSASMDALNPTIGGARDVLTQAGNLIKDYQTAQQQSKQDAQGIVHDAIAGGSDALAALIRSQPDVVKLAGYNNDTLNGVLLGLKKQEAASSYKAYGGGSGGSSSTTSGQQSYSTIDISRYGRAANSIVKNYIALPQYSLTANGYPFLQRIQAANAEPGSVSDAELLDSIVKLNTGGGQVTEAQVKLITGGQSLSDALNVWKNKLGNGGVLSQSQRQQLTDLANAVYARYAKDYQPVYNQVTSQLKAAGIPEAFWTIPDLNSLSGGQNQQQSSNLLLNNPSFGGSGSIPASSGLSQTSQSILDKYGIK